MKVERKVERKVPKNKFFGLKGLKSSKDLHHEALCRFGSVAGAVR